MYVGSTMCFAATALWYERPAGLLVTAYVYVVYLLALKYEGCVCFSGCLFLVRVVLISWVFDLQALDGHDLLRPLYSRHQTQRLLPRFEERTLMFFS